MATRDAARGWWLATGAALAMALAPRASLADDGILFAGDDRGPDIVFNEGLVPRGTNVNVMQHLTGVSCWDPAPGLGRSAYIAMSESPRDPLAYANHVYRIRPHFYAPDETAAFSLSEGFNAILRDWQALGLDLRQRSEIEALLRFPWFGTQHLSLRIPPEWIESVGVYIRDGNNNPRLVRLAGNPNYRQPARMGSRREFSQAMLDTVRRHRPGGGQVRYAVAPNVSTAPACMDPGGACGGAGPSALARSLDPSGRKNKLTCVTEPLLLPGNRMQRAVDVILSP